VVPIKTTVDFDGLDNDVLVNDWKKRNKEKYGLTINFSEAEGLIKAESKQRVQKIKNQMCHPALEKLMTSPPPGFRRVSVKECMDLFRKIDERDEE